MTTRNGWRRRPEARPGCTRQVFELTNLPCMMFGNRNKRPKWLGTLPGALFANVQQVLDTTGCFFELRPALRVSDEIFLLPRFIRDDSEVMRLNQVATSWCSNLWALVVKIN